MSFPELLRQCRKQKHMSQAELASLLGVTQQAVGKWESGKSSPDPATVAKLAEILDTTADYLLGLFDPASEGQTEERFFGSYVYSLIPVIGTVKAGYGALAYEEDYGKEYALALDDQLLVSRVEGLQHDAVAPLQIPLEGAFALVAVDQHAQIAVFQRVLLVDEGEVAVLNARLHNELVIKGDDLNRLHIAGRVVETKAKW